jgi:hypothetical protein
VAETHAVDTHLGSLTSLEVINSLIWPSGPSAHRLQSVNAIVVATAIAADFGRTTPRVAVATLGGGELPFLTVRRQFKLTMITERRINSMAVV